jgi:PAS domain S-box-containing protein
MMEPLLINPPLKIAVIYALAGALWILLSGWVLQLMETDPAVITRLTMFKGWAFIAVTALILYRLTARDHAEVRQASAAVKEQEELLRNVLETLPVGVWIIDREGKITHGNPAGQRIWGGARFVGMEQFGDYKGWWLDTGKRIEAAEWGGARAIREGKTTIGEEIEIEGFAGIRRIILHSVAPLRNQQNEIVGAVVVNEDITSRKQIEEALRQTQTNLKSILASVSDTHILFDRQWRYLYVNKAAARAIGLPREQIPGRTLWELFPDIVGSEIDRQYHRAMDERIPVVCEFYYPSRDEWWENRFYPSPEGLSVFATDITLRKKAEDALRESEQRFRSYFELGLVGTAITLPGNGFLAVNDKLCEIFGYQRSELMEMTWLDMLHPDNPAAAVAKFKGVLTGESDDLTQENRFIRKDGQVMYAILSVKCLRRADGSADCCLVHVQDITESRQAEERIAVYQEQLLFMAAEISLIEERERRQLAITLHDQIGQVLAMAKIKLGALQAAGAVECRRPAEEIRELLEQAIKSSRSLTFELSPPILYELGFEKALQALCENFQQQHGLQVDFDTDGAPKPLSDDIQILLYRAVQELLVNIVKHAGVVKSRVSCRRGGSRLFIEITDDGKGFEPAADCTHSPAARGFGLFSIRERLHYLGGEMTVASTPGCGTRVTLVAQLQETVK